jgi:hypothetical protein
MKKKWHASLIGALGALFIFSGSGEAGLLDKLSEWAESINPKFDSRQLRFYADENCKKYFEKGDLERAKLFCITAAKQNRSLLYYAAVTEYKDWWYNKHRGKSSAWAREYLKEAEKYLLERLKIEGSDPQAEIEIKKRLANVYLWLGETYYDIYERLQDNYTSSAYLDARNIAVEYFKKALSLTEELGDKGDSYVIAWAGRRLGAIYLDDARFGYSLVEKAEAILNKALSAIEKAQPSVIVSKDEIQWAKEDIYNLLGIVQSWKLSYNKANEQDYKKGEEYFLKVIDMSKKSSPDDLPVLNYNLAVLHLAAKNYDKYVEYAKKAIELEGKKGPKSNKKKLAEWHGELAEVYLKHLNDKQRAKQHYIFAVELYESLMQAEREEFKRIDYERKRNMLLEEINKINKELRGEIK